LQHGNSPFLLFLHSILLWQILTENATTIDSFTLLADEHFAFEKPFKSEKKPREHNQRPEKAGR
jgi:hypothetical protein